MEADVISFVQVKWSLINLQIFNHVQMIEKHRFMPFLNAISLPVIQKLYAGSYIENANPNPKLNFYISITPNARQQSECTCNF